MSKVKTKKTVANEAVTQEVKKEMRYDLLALIASGKEEDQQAIQAALESGYEPFAVVPHMIAPENNILSPGQPIQPKMTNLIWMKRGIMIEIKESGV